MRKLSILIVEDGTSQREMLKGFLLSEGYDVSEAKKGDEALEMLKKD